MATFTHGGRRRGLLMLALAAVVAGAVLVAVAMAGQQSAPAVATAGTLPAPASPPPVSPRATPAPAAPAAGPPPLPPSPPVRISIPALGIRSPVHPLGLDRDGGLQVPQPGPHLNQAAWFDKSPTPGQPGPAVIEGHVDTVKGPSVFFELGRIRPGDRVRVRRADGRTVVFTVDAVRDFPKSRFPSRLVYGGEDLSTPQLRLITCSDFDASIGHHTGNEVVFAHLTDVRG